MDNKLRNEVSIELAGETRVMRATFTAIVNIERQLNRSMMEIINRLANGNLSITETATIIYHGLRGYDDNRLSLEQVGTAVIAAGLSNVSMPVVEFVSASLNGVSVGKPDQPTEVQ